MTKILNHINTYADLTAYNNDKDKNYPNIAYIIETNEVKWVKEKLDLVVCKYNATSTSEATKLLFFDFRDVTYQIIDDVKQDTVKDTYTFDTLGEHIVKYKLDGTSISDYLFNGCSSLTSISIPDIVTSIGMSAFSSCSGLTSIVIPNSVISIGMFAFSSCSGLTSIVIPNSVISIEDFALRECTSLESIVVDSANTVFDSRDNCNALIHTSTNKLISGCKNTVIPNTVTSIGESSFYFCSTLTNIVIPNSVTSIGNDAFWGCRNLASVTIQATIPPTLGNTTVFEQTNNCPIYVPAESVDAYKTATNWSSLADRISAIVA